MSLAERISVINRAFFSSASPAIETRQILPDGTQEVVNWTTVRAALLELDAMPWCHLQDEWQYFLDEKRYPIGTTLELTPDRVNIFQSITRQLRDQIEEPIRVLASVHPDISANDITVTIDSTDLETIESAVRHVRAVASRAAIDDAVTVASVQTGSLDIILTAGKITLLGLQMAIILAKRWKDPRSKTDARRLQQMLKRIQPDTHSTEDDALEIVHNETKDEFWEHISDTLQAAFENAGKGSHEFNEAKSKIEHAAKEIHDTADAVATEWNLPPATIHGLPGGAIVHLNFDNPEEIGRVIKAIAAPPDQK